MKQFGLFILLFAMPLAAIAKDQPIKLMPADGCFRYIGDATEFAGRFKAGSYIGVTMNSLDENGFPITKGEEPRSPVMDAPEHRTDDGIAWFGPLAETRMYGITFVPMAEFGRSAVVTVCGRMSAPQ